MPRARRATVAAIVAGGPALALWALIVGSRLPPPPPPENVTTLVFIAPYDEAEPEPVQAPDPATPAPLATPAPDTASAASPPRSARAPAPVAAEPAPSPDTSEPEPGAMVAVEPTPRTDGALRLYDADGTIALPDDVVARIAEVESDERAFGFQLPGLMESGRFMDRPPVMAYEATRFDRYWIPEQGMLTKILEKAVKATTGTVEIPIPGTRGGKLVCSISLLAIGGGCGVINNNRGYVVSLDDPETLNPEEDAQCRAWWDQIVEAGDQDSWRYTRDLYDATCRKPLAKDLSPPG